MSARLPSGRARGALAGSYREPAIGLSLAAGMMRADDFGAIDAAAATVGDLRWRLVSVGGAATSANLITSAPTEHGLVRITTASGTGQGAVVVSQVQHWPASGLGIGTIIASKAKIRNPATSCDAWTGLSSSTALYPSPSAAVSFIGWRAQNGGSWAFVVKNGAASETAIASAASSTAWQWLGFEAIDTDGAGTIGYQPFTLDASDRRQLIRTNLGGPITTTTPSIALYTIPIAIISQTASTRSADIDCWQEGGRIAR